MVPTLTEAKEARHGGTQLESQRSGRGRQNALTNTFKMNEKCHFKKFTICEYECFAGTTVCIPCACLVPVEATDRLELELKDGCKPSYAGWGTKTRSSASHKHVQSQDIPSPILGLHVLYMFCFSNFRNTRRNI